MSIRKRQSVLARAASATLYHATEDDKGGGAAGDDKGKGKDEQRDEQREKLTITKDEFNELVQSKVDAALTAEREKSRKEREREQSEAARKKAEEDGNFKTLADDAEKKRKDAEAERDAAKLDKRKLEVKDRLRDYLAEKHPAYAAAAKWIMPAVEFDLATDDKDIEKRIASAADAYVKDNPRQTGGGGAPGQTGRGQRAAEGERKKTDDDANGKERPLSRTARMAF